MIALHELRQDDFTDADPQESGQERADTCKKCADEPLLGFTKPVGLSVAPGNFADLGLCIHRIVVVQFRKHVARRGVAQNNRAQDQHEDGISAFQQHFLFLQYPEHQRAGDRNRHRDADERKSAFEVDQPLAVIADKAG